MIGYLKGTIVEVLDDTVILDVGGIGYLIEMPASFLAKLPPLGHEAQIYTRLIVRDDQINLYGFLDKKALLVFKVLLEVSGVGPKLALNVLSVLSPEDLVSDIAKGDTSRIRSVHGVGKKTAARICVDLKEKAAKILAKEGRIVQVTDYNKAGQVDESLLDDAVSALVNLGYRPHEAKRVLSQIVSKHGALEVDKLIKMALQRISKVK